MHIKSAFYVSFLLLVSSFNGEDARAKGLADLEQSNPENDETGQPTSEEKSGDAEKPEATPLEPKKIHPLESSIHEKIKERLNLATSFGLVRALQTPQGVWKTGGMSDITIAYSLLELFPQLMLSASFRYAPISVTGTKNSQLIHGVWEFYQFGALFHYRIQPKTTLIGATELAVVKASYAALNHQDVKDSSSNLGAMFCLGAGADFYLLENAGFSIGPRLYAGIGSYSTLQLSAAATMTF